MQRPAAEILTIGDELLKGSTLNTNAQFLGRHLTGLGFKVLGQSACPDDAASIHRSLGEALRRAQLVILTGGLGPTPDDVTREGIASYFGVPLSFSRRQYDWIVKAYRRRRKKVPVCVRKEAMFPANAVPMFNRYGIALGFYIAQGGQLVLVFPGVPRELENMFLNLGRPLIEEQFPDMQVKQTLILKTVGLSEPEIMERLGKGFFEKPFDFGIYPYPGEAAIRIQTEKASLARDLRRKAVRAFGDSIYAFEDANLAEVAGARLTARRRTVAVAESCTGGQLAAEFTTVPGASAFFKGGIVAYSNEVKESHLDVPAAVLKRYGAVSIDAAAAMARTVRSRMQSTYGIGVTGIAGPSGGSPRKPVGTVYIALAGPKETRVWPHRFSGDRILVQRKSVHKALEYLWRELGGARSSSRRTSSRR